MTTSQFSNNFQAVTKSDTAVKHSQAVTKSETTVKDSRSVIADDHFDLQTRICVVYKWVHTFHLSDLHSLLIRGLFTVGFLWKTDLYRRIICTQRLLCLITDRVLVFYSEEKKWAWHKNHQCLPCREILESFGVGLLCVYTNPSRTLVIASS